MTQRSLRRSQAIIASLLAGLVLLLNALAASPALHELFHPDANNSFHACAVTLFAHGHVDTAAADVIISKPLVFATSLPCPVTFAFRPVIEQLPAGRAPPAVSLHS